MQFKLDMAKMAMHPVDDAKNIVALEALGFNFKPEYGNQLIPDPETITIEISSIDDLLKLMKDAGERLILEGDRITIYNWYVE